VGSPSTTFGQTEKKTPRMKQGIICILVAQGGIETEPRMSDSS